MGKLHQITRKVNFMYFLNELSDLKSTILPGKSFQILIIRSLKKYKRACDNCVAYTACTDGLLYWWWISLKNSSELTQRSPNNIL